MNKETPTEDSLTALQKEIADAVAYATQPMMRQLDRMERELTALHHGDTSECLSVKEAAKHLNVGEATIRRRARDGVYETRRDGDRIIQIRRADVVG